MPAAGFLATALALTPTAYFRLGEVAGAGTVLSEVGSVTGTVPGTGVTLGVAGGLASLSNTSAQFDDTNGIALSGLPASFSSKISFHCLFKASVVTSTYQFYSHRIDANNYIHIFTKPNDDIEVRAVIGGTAFGIRLSGLTLEADRWYRLVVILDTTAARRELYLDGVEGGTDIASGISTSDVAAYIGARNNNTITWDGCLDEVIIHYGTAWTAQQVADLDAAALNPARYEVIKRDILSSKDTFVAAIDPSIVQYTVTGLLADSTAYYYIRAYTSCGAVDVAPVTTRLRTVAMDGANALIPPAPNAPKGLRLITEPAGKITARWRYDGNDAEAAATKFEVFVAEGAASFNYAVPTYTVTTIAQDNTQDLGTFAHGTSVKCVVRAVATSDSETNTTQATAVADTTAPGAPVTVAVTVTT